MKTIKIYDFPNGLKKTDCDRCTGFGNVPDECPDGNPGCLVLHYRACPRCSGTGQVPIIVEIVKINEVTTSKE